MGRGLVPAGAGPPTRSLSTIALLGALGHYEELAMHVKATRNAAANQSEIAKAPLHVAVDAGVASKNRAFAAANGALEASTPRMVTK